MSYNTADNYRSFFLHEEEDFENWDGEEDDLDEGYEEDWSELDYDYIDPDDDDDPMGEMYEILHRELDKP